jgi:hypothetical protein
VSGLFDLMYAVFNTFFALPTQAAQVKCFQACATEAERIHPRAVCLRLAAGNSSGMASRRPSHFALMASRIRVC